MSLDWELVAEKKECSGSETEKGTFHIIDNCASQCNGVASMFAFGTNDFGEPRCYNNGCRCLCETSATAEGTCNKVNHKGYRLYRYSNQGDYYLYHNLYVSNIILTRANGNN